MSTCRSSHAAPALDPPLRRVVRRLGAADGASAGWGRHPRHRDPTWREDCESSARSGMLRVPLITSPGWPGRRRRASAVGDERAGPLDKDPPRRTHDGEHRLPPALAVVVAATAYATLPSSVLF